MRGVEDVVRDVEVGEVACMRCAVLLHEFLRVAIEALSEQHHRGAMAVVCAAVDALVAAHALEPHPDIGLDVFEQVSDVNLATCIGQGTGDEDPSLRGAHGLAFRGSEGRERIPPGPRRCIFDACGCA